MDNETAGLIGNGKNETGKTNNEWPQQQAYVRSRIEWCLTVYSPVDSMLLETFRFSRQNNKKVQIKNCVTIHLDATRHQTCSCFTGRNRIKAKFKLL